MSLGTSVESRSGDFGGGVARTPDRTAGSVPRHGSSSGRGGGRGSVSGLKSTLSVSSSRAQIEDYVRGLSKQEVNRRDIFGRTLLHLAATSGRADVVAALLEHHHVDLVAGDYESGWSALHRALAAGSLSAGMLLLAKGGAGAIRTKDRARETPFEVMSAMLATQPTPWQRRGTELFMFGSNANHNLGFADHDDRAHPEIARLEPRPGATVFERHRIADVRISKLHTAVITAGGRGNLYVCGFARGGRLGLGKVQERPAQFTFARVGGALDRERVIDVAVGVDHTIAITDDGECFTWGANAAGQLGLPGSANVYEPRKVLGELRRKPLIGCAASNVHSVAFTADELYTWGKNAGQLGYLSDYATGSSGFGEQDDGKAIYETAPRKVLYAFPDHIEMVRATDIATIVLFANHEVWVLMNGGYFRVSFPLEARRSDNFDAYQFHKQPAYVTKIAATASGAVCALMSDGTVFGFTLAPLARASLRPSQLAKQLQVSTVWVGRNKHLRAVDVDVGDDGAFILCTESGGVWRRVARGKNKSSKSNKEFKFERVPLINRVHQVRCDSQFQAFAAIRTDIELQPIAVTTASVADDLHYLAPFVAGEHSHPMFRWDETTPREPLVFSRPGTLHSGAVVKGLGIDEDVPQPSGVPEYDGINAWLASATEEALAEDLRARPPSSPDHDLAIVAETVRMCVHSCVLRARVPNLVPLIDGAVPDITTRSGARITADTTGLHFFGFRLTTVIAFIYYVYTDFSLKPWGTFARNVPKHLLEAKKELEDLKSTLGLDNLWTEVYRDASARRDLNGDLVALIDDETTADAIIHLADDKVAYAHTFILKARSDFFETLLKEDWSRDRYHDGKVHIYLSEIESSHFRVVLRHLYGDSITDPFGRTFETPKAAIRFILDVLAAADYLLLYKLEEICQSALLEFVNVKNAGWLLNEISNYSQLQLRSRLLFYLCQNMECILENGFLYNLDDCVIADIEEAMKAASGSIVPPESRWNKGQVLFDFINDSQEHDEAVTARVPILGIKADRGGFSMMNTKLVSTTTPDKTDKGDDDGVFVLDMDDSGPAKPLPKKDTPQSKERTASVSASSPWVTSSQPKMSTSPTVSPWTVVKSKNSPSTSRVGSFTDSPLSSTPSKDSPWTSSNPSPKLGAGPFQVEGKRRLSSHSGSRSEASKLSSMLAAGKPPVSTPTRQSAATAGASTASQLSSPTPSANMSFIAPVVKEVQPKLSQKERRRLQRAGKQPEQQPGQPTGGLAGSSVSGPWKISSPTTAAAESPFAAYKNGSQKTKAQAKRPEVYQPTMADIIRQEQRDLQEQQRHANKTLKEIQQEEEFNKWWAAEAKREAERQKAAEAAANAPRANPSKPKRSRHPRRGHDKPGPSKPRDKVAVDIG